jgi:uncharacterized protein YjbJ (UPF0337 family)
LPIAEPRPEEAVFVAFSATARGLKEWLRACPYTREGEYIPMNWDRVEGNWKQMKGKAREQWGKLTDSDWEQVAGKKDQLVGRIQERYGISKDEAQKQADEWARTQADVAESNVAHERNRETVKR